MFCSLANKPLKQGRTLAQHCYSNQVTFESSVRALSFIEEMPSSPALRRGSKSLVHNSGTYFVRIRENVLVLRLHYM